MALRLVLLLSVAVMTTINAPIGGDTTAVPAASRATDVVTLMARPQLHAVDRGVFASDSTSAGVRTATGGMADTSVNVVVAQAAGADTTFVGSHEFGVGEGKSQQLPLTTRGLRTLQGTGADDSLGGLASAKMSIETVVDGVVKSVSASSHEELVKMVVRGVSRMTVDGRPLLRHYHVLMIQRGVWRDGSRLKGSVYAKNWTFRGSSYDLTVFGGGEFRYKAGVPVAKFHYASNRAVKAKGKVTFKSSPAARPPPCAGPSAAQASIITQEFRLCNSGCQALLFGANPLSFGFCSLGCSDEFAAKIKIASTLC